MGISISVFAVDPRDISPLCQYAESLGFEGAWFGEHLLAPLKAKSRHPRSTPETAQVLYEGTPLIDLPTTFAHVAASTTTLWVGAGVLVLPLRDPVSVARAFSNAHILAGGRMKFGVAAGWLKEEFDFVGVPFEERGARFNEAVELIQALWTGEIVTHHGRFWRLEDVQLWPPPETRVPWVFGGTSDPALRRAARWGDGWICPAKLLLDDVNRVRERLEQLRQDVGRSHLPFDYHVRLEGPQTREMLERYQAAGYEHLSLPTADAWRHPDLKLNNGHRKALLRWYADALWLHPPAISSS
jgi:probable F420-dependent oxidoreductase